MVKKERLNYWQYGLSTHPGSIKQINEDTAFIRLGENAKGRKFSIAIVADGMSGHNSGDIASKVVLDEIKKWLDKRLYHLVQKYNPIKHIRVELNEVIKRTNELLVELGRDKSIILGTTISLLFLIDSKFLILNVGDSRVYKVEDLDNVPNQNENTYFLNQLTEDQSLVTIQQRKGIISIEEARIHPKRNVLLQCLGVKPELEIEIKQGKHKHGDMFLLCSDGLHTVIPDNIIAQLIYESEEQDKDLQWISDQLVQKVLELGAADNISVVLIRQTSNKGWKRIFSLFNRYKVIE